jgi:hypothetical protein
MSKSRQIQSGIGEPTKAGDSTTLRHFFASFSVNEQY